jgi:hypothetical protein
MLSVAMIYMMNNDLKSMWKEVVVAWFKVLSQNSAGLRKSKKPSVRIACLQDNILISDLRLRSRYAD